MDNSIILYDQLIATNSNIERKGKTTPYTSINGHMFTFLAKDGTMGLRLSENDREAFIEKFSSQLMEQHGRTMKEYVQVSMSQLEDIELISPYLKLSYDFVSTLKPKPTKKK